MYQDPQNEGCSSGLAHLTKVNLSQHTLKENTPSRWPLTYTHHNPPTLASSPSPRKQDPTANDAYSVKLLPQMPWEQCSAACEPLHSRPIDCSPLNKGRH